jgi:hypothetical protein
MDDLGKVSARSTTKGKLGKVITCGKRIDKRKEARRDAPQRRGVKKEREGRRTQRWKPCAPRWRQKTSQERGATSGRDRQS